MKSPRPAESNVTALPFGPRESSRLPPAGGGDNYGGMDGWQTSVESRLHSIDGRLGRIEDKGDRHFERLNDKMDSHLYLTWGGLIAGVIVFAGMMAVGFGWI